MISKQDSSTSVKIKSLSTAIHVKRIGPIIKPDINRVLIRPFSPSNEDIIRRMISDAMSLPEKEVENLLQHVMGEFSDRHENIEEFFLNRFNEISYYMDDDVNIAHARKLLIGSLFSHEYSPESAALFNPSIVLHPDQSDVPAGAVRFILSLRAVGEGHISSITFRTGTVSPLNRITLNSPVPFAEEPVKITNCVYEKELFYRKLLETGLHNNFCRRVVIDLPDKFTLEDLKNAIHRQRQRMSPVDTIADRASQGILLLAQSNYEVHFNPKSKISQRIIFPSAPSQSNGIEDARFVRFTNDDGSYTYYGTYTAYDGKITLPQLLETEDFINFKFITLNGAAVQNKGMALFPRKIGDKFVMLSRQDDESIFIMYSDNIHFWQTTDKIMSPLFPWEYIKIGTCGSPIETEAGWLVMSHGVGPMRKYSISAFLLDLENPAKIIGRLKTPLLTPNEAEREGYVPNVVYTCGAILNGRELILPYAMSDYASSFATVSLDEILNAME